MSRPTRRIVQFSAPRHAEVVEEPLPSPAPNEVVVRSVLSAISPGTERLIYRGQVPDQFGADATIPALSGDLTFPLRYGYACVGVVEEVGSAIDPSWKSRRVFAFHPHASRFTAEPEDLIVLPDRVSDEDAALIPNVETAVNLVMDGRPMIGERVVIFGLGIVGLLTTALVSGRRVGTVLTLDPVESRRERSKEVGADETFDPGNEIEALKNRLNVTGADTGSIGTHCRGADLTIEVSGVPSALNDAIAVTGFDGRVLVGSWYASPDTALDLGTHFHRSRIEIFSSQVSTVNPDHSGRWSKDRRMDVVLELLTNVRPGRFITDRYTPEQAKQAYADLDNPEMDVLQPVFEYN